MLFDYGGTLFRSTRPWSEVRADGLAAAHVVLRRKGLTMTIGEFVQLGDSVFKKYAEVEAKEDKDIPDRLKYQEIVDTIFPELPKASRRRLATEANRAFWETATKSYPLRKSAVRALENLKASGIRMGVVSNHHDYESLVSHLEESGIKSHFEVILASEKEGVRKPNAAIFARSLSALKVKKHHAVFVGDSPRHDIVGARAAGITAILIDDGEQPDTWVNVPGHITREDAKPDFVIDDLLTLHEIVQSLRGDQNSSGGLARGRPTGPIRKKGNRAGPRGSRSQSS